MRRSIASPGKISLRDRKFWRDMDGLHQRAGGDAVGLEILKRGGSAVDAAIAANATLGLMEPVSNGIGGDLFAIVYSAKENKLYGINGSGRSPLGLSYEQMKAELDKAEPRDYSPARNVADQCAGMRRCLGGATQEIRETEIERRSRPGDSLCRGRFSRDRVDRVLLAFRSASFTKVCREHFWKPTRSMAKGRTPAKVTFSKIRHWRERCD